jgi:hypothetical protein
MAASLVPKALQIFHQLRGNRQVAGVEAFNLIDAGASVLGEREDVDLAPDIASKGASDVCSAFPSDAQLRPGFDPKCGTTLVAE